MKFPHILISTLSLVVALSAGGVYAADHEEHGAHEHGAATLSFAADLSSRLFSSPEGRSFSVFGFGASLRRGLAVSTCGFVSRLRVWDRIFRPSSRKYLL